MHRCRARHRRRGRHELAVDAAPLFRLATAFDELRPVI
jgi:hypothetical protein